MKVTRSETWFFISAETSGSGSYRSIGGSPDTRDRDSEFAARDGVDAATSVEARGNG